MKKKALIVILIILICVLIRKPNLTYPKEKTNYLANENIESTINTYIDNANNIELEIEANNIIVEQPPEKQEEISKESSILEKQSNSKASITKKENTASTKKNIQTNDNTTNKTESSKNNNSASINSSTDVKNEQYPKETTEQSTKKSVEKTQTEVIEKTTEPIVKEQPTRCTNNNNHGMNVGNCGKWFDSKNEAIAYYEEKTSYWSKLWESYQITDDEYYKNCPSGYEILSCMYCSKWTINCYYR